ncbi:UV DNA damage repair endonuclease UvsE [Clostridium sp. DL1XJH146]
MIGYACIPLAVPYKTTRKFLLKNFTEENFYNAANLNLIDLLRILEYNKNNNINFFRISSDIIPFAGHSINDIKWEKCFENNFSQIGTYIKENNLRVSMHPGQYSVINSPNENVVQNSIKDIDYHSNFLDLLQLDYTHKIVIHIGGVYGNKTEAIERFEKNYQKLSFSSKNRVIIENDDKSYTLQDVLKISNSLNIPVVFDNLHHKCNPSLDWSYKKIFEGVSTTWNLKDGKMKTHYSQADPLKNGRSHSKTIMLKEFLDYYSEIKGFDTDIMLEVKDKNISALKCINSLSINPSKSTLTSEWAKYKYLVMEKDYALYKKGSHMMNSDTSIEHFYYFIDECISLPYSKGNFINTAEHIWGYFKDKATLREKNSFFKAIKEFDDPSKIKKRLYNLSLKYNEDYLNSSYYFYY